MAPTAFVFLRELPLTPSGKIDRTALPPVDHSELDLDATYSAPRTPIEEVIAGIWADVLGLERVGVASNFFELGGHSLLATQVVARVRTIYQVELPLRVLFEEPTVAGLAAAIAQSRPFDQRLQPPPIPHAPRGGDPPLSFPQERLWILHQFNPSDTSYHRLPRALRHPGD